MQVEAHVKQVEGQRNIVHMKLQWANLFLRRLLVVLGVCRHPFLDLVRRLSVCQLNVVLRITAFVLQTLSRLNVALDVMASLQQEAMLYWGNSAGNEHGNKISSRVYACARALPTMHFMVATCSGDECDEGARDGCGGSVLCQICLVCCVMAVLTEHGPLRLRRWVSASWSSRSRTERGCVCTCLDHRMLG